MADKSKHLRRSSQRISSQKSVCKRMLGEEYNSPYFKTSQKRSNSFVQAKKIKFDDSDRLHTDTHNNNSTTAETISETFVKTTRERLGRTFYERCATDLAKALLGKRIYCILEDGEVLSARIVETEGYLGETDPACHSYGGKQTARTEAMYMPPGTVYVYFIYGMYFCLNISSRDTGGAVLIRALQPIEGIQRMTKLRQKKRNGSSKALKVKDLCSGPSKLCQAMHITKETLNKEDMVSSNTLWIEDDPDIGNNFRIVTSTRIGVTSYGQEAAKMPLRFYVFENKCSS